MIIRMVDRWGRQVVMELIGRHDLVEAVCAERAIGTADREYLRAWLANPEGVYAYDRMMWTVATHGVTLTIDDLVAGWTIEGTDFAALLEFV